jgi:sigma-B regulation protein RsbU (phosphoserine phosphatase)
LDVEDGYPLGLLDSDYSGNQIKFSQGDVFIFFTDGVTEARNMKANMYGNERFVSVVEKNKTASAREILKAIETDLRRFEPEYKQSDDITCIVLKVN